jgi:hypothetical protein
MGARVLISETWYYPRHRRPHVVTTPQVTAGKAAWLRPKTALSFLLRMEIRFPDLCPFYQNIDPSEHSRVGDRRRDAAIMFDVSVELDALLTHSLVSHLRAGTTRVARRRRIRVPSPLP